MRFCGSTGAPHHRFQPGVLLRSPCSRSFVRSVCRAIPRGLTRRPSLAAPRPPQRAANELATEQLERVNQSNLAGVRAKDALARLPEEERKEWERLWSDVDALLRRFSPPK
jgi:hypothetical protein